MIGIFSQDSIIITTWNLQVKPIQYTIFVRNTNSKSQIDKEAVIAKAIFTTWSAWHSPQLLLVEPKQLRLMCGSQLLKNEKFWVINLLKSSDSSFPAGYNVETGWSFLVQLLLLFKFSAFYNVHHLLSVTGSYYFNLLLHFLTAIIVKMVRYNPPQPDKNITCWASKVLKFLNSLWDWVLQIIEAWRCKCMTQLLSEIWRKICWQMVPKYTITCSCSYRVRLWGVAWRVKQSGDQKNDFSSSVEPKKKKT